MFRFRVGNSQYSTCIYTSVCKNDFFFTNRIFSSPVLSHSTRSLLRLVDIRWLKSIFLYFFPTYAFKNMLSPAANITLLWIGFRREPRTIDSGRLKIDKQEREKARWTRSRDDIATGSVGARGKIPYTRFL